MLDQIAERRWVLPACRHPAVMGSPRHADGALEHLQPDGRGDLSVLSAFPALGPDARHHDGPRQHRSSIPSTVTLSAYISGRDVRRTDAGLPAATGAVLGTALGDRPRQRGTCRPECASRP